MAPAGSRPAVSPSRVSLVPLVTSVVLTGRRRLAPFSVLGWSKARTVLGTRWSKS